MYRRYARVKNGLELNSWSVVTSEAVEGLMISLLLFKNIPLCDFNFRATHAKALLPAALAKKI